MQTRAGSRRTHYRRYGSVCGGVLETRARSRNAGKGGGCGGNGEGHWGAVGGVKEKLEVREPESEMVAFGAKLIALAAERLHFEE